MNEINQISLTACSEVVTGIYETEKLTLLP